MHTPTVLKSKQFAGNHRLSACLASHQAHVTPGSTGIYVNKIQEAVILLDNARIDPNEILRSHYGRSTADVVLAYKTKRNIVNQSYQSHADNIVGKMTIASLDEEMLNYERRDRGGLAGWMAFTPAASSGGSPPTDREYLEDGAKRYEDLCRILREDNKPHVMVDAVTGHLRSTICQNAGALPLGGNFVKEYWDVVTPARSVDRPLPAWCGIFATWIWKTQAQMDVDWATNGTAAEGASNGPYKSGSKARIKTSTAKGSIAPGDIIVESPDPFHHLVVLAVSADRVDAVIAEGNAGTGDAYHTVTRKKFSYGLRNASYFYSVDSYRWPHVNYGGSGTPGGRP
jgi:hypothetical protein